MSPIIIRIICNKIPCLVFGNPHYFLLLRYGTENIIAAFIDWKYGAMGWDKSINKKPITWKQFVRKLLPSTPASIACTLIADMVWGYPQ